MKLDKIIAKRPDKVVYQDGDKVIKVFGHSFSKANVLNEALCQARVEETGLNIPRLHEVTVLEDGRWAIVIDYIGGRTLEELMSESPKDAAKYMVEFVQLQMSIHEKRSPLLTNIRDKMQRKISETKLDKTSRYDLHLRIEGMPKLSSVLHGDFNPSNVIITKDGTPYIIDWAHATQGNPAADIARTYLYFLLNSSSEIAELYLNKFCNMSEIDKTRVMLWMPIVAASQSVKGNPNEQERLMKMIDIVDYQ